MALKITLKPNERMIIDGAVITNGSKVTDFVIENKVPVLRQSDILREEEADSPCRRIYFAIQLMYVDKENQATHYANFWNLAQDTVKAAPSMVGFVDQISEHISSNRYYQAIKITKKMIEYEQEVLSRAQ
ncbi:MAG: flagellar biosynthesis repressor FlbT [Thermodesulfobacteriota bacterium]|nr:flagellar biosynthesis repressor FlbT [Thermodesulfobacteriota bacterium]